MLASIDAKFPSSFAYFSASSGDKGMFSQLKQIFFKKHMSSVELYSWCSCCVLRHYSVRLFFLCKTCDFHIETTQPRSVGFPIERFHSRGQHLCKFIRTKESVYIKEKSFTPKGLAWNTNMPPWRHVKTLRYPVLLTSCFRYRKRLPNLVNASWLWRISRGIWANQKRQLKYYE